jgi:N-acetylmuramoyl-L-alanine amidase
VTYQFYIQKTELNGQVSPGTSAVISVEKLNNTELLPSTHGIETELDSATGCFTLTTLEVGTYRMNATIGGMTVSNIVNVYYPWFKDASKSQKQPLTNAIRLTGLVVQNNNVNSVYGKICAGDCNPLNTARPRIRIVPTSGTSVFGDPEAYAGLSCTYTSSSPLVQVDALGYISVVQYIPKDTPVTITATLINDPAKHVVTIPITVTSQNLARTVVIYKGSTPTSFISGQLANRSTLRLSALAMLSDGKTLADNSGVVWSSSKPSVVSVDGTGKVTFVGAGTATVTAPNLSLAATVGNIYLVANGRYLFIPDSCRLVNGHVMVPIRAMARAFNAAVNWNDDTRIVSVTKGSGAITPGSVFYDKTDLYWMSRIIFAEARGESLKGKIAVGGVIMNRIASPLFPDTVYDVIFDKHYGVQFTPAYSGAIYNTPSEECIIAAKVALDGGNTAGSSLYFAATTHCWAGRSRPFAMTIGHHYFYA